MLGSCRRINPHCNFEVHSIQNSQKINVSVCSNDSDDTKSISSSASNKYDDKNDFMIDDEEETEFPVGGKTHFDCGFILNTVYCKLYCALCRICCVCVFVCT